ncbi:hypothetical protein ACQ4PT_040852 [Festuca glaucescens]
MCTPSSQLISHYSSKCYYYILLKSRRRSCRTASPRVIAPPLPLIICPRCGVERTISYVSSTEANPGIRFYKCPKQGENGTCDFFLWDQHYAYFITGVGINLLIEATGGTSNYMFGLSGLIRDIKAVVMNTFIVCIIILAVLAYHVSNKIS